jgi:multiple sugar transport system substrate-binding protein
MRRRLAVAAAVVVAALISGGARAEEKIVVWWNKGFYEAEDKALEAVIRGGEVVVRVAAGVRLDN